jgi:glucose-6-phosphate-specific signal transduction histidine kinase
LTDFLFVGASGVASIGGRSAYYTVKAGSALSRLAGMLKHSAKNLWKVANVIFKISKFSVKNFKTFTIGGSSMTLLRLLPFIPPVVVGIHVLFAAFWPKRVLFFHASQRRRFIDGQFTHWCLILLLLILALSINTALVDEFQNAFNESLPLLDVHVLKKFGWKMSLAASSFSMASALSYITAYYTLKLKTDKDHENLANEEKEWARFVDSKKKCTYHNTFGLFKGL